MTSPPSVETAEVSRGTISPAGVAVRAAISLAILGGSVGLMFAIGRGAPPKRQPTDDTLPLVEVQRVQSYTGGIDFDVDGVVIPFREIEIPAEVAGRIEFKSENCRMGHTVEKDDLLVRIDQEDYELEIRSIGESVKQARANLQELEVQITARKRQIELAEEDLVLKRREVARYENIDDPGVYSKSELDAARLKELQARDALQTEQDQLTLLEASRDRLGSAIDLGIAQLEKAKLDLARTEIRAPIAGIITREGPEEGGYVQRGGMVAAVQDSTLMEIRCSLPMSQMSWLWQSPPSEGVLPRSKNAYQLPETPATVHFDMGATACKWEGKLAYFDGGSVDQQTRMVPCRVVVDRPEEVEFVGEVNAAVRSAPITLLTGMFVTVQVHASPGIPLLRLPERAVQPGNQVWTIEPTDNDSSKRGTLHQRHVNVAHVADDFVLAYLHGSELSAGELVVVSPLATPTEAAEIEFTESP
jgi:multidrug efflux pump subunit AcrA (membrane-fusion protein)